MNLINRFEETWSPEWDLGLQDEFGFSSSEDESKAPALTTERPNAWAMASREVLNRQSPVECQTVSDSSSVDKLVVFLEALIVEIDDK